MPDDEFTGETVAAASAAMTPDASPASDPSTIVAGALPAPEAAAPVQAVGDGVTTTTDPAAPAADPTAPPTGKWPTILANARTKAVAETEAKYGWAKTIPDAHRATVGEFYATLETDPTRAIESLILTAANDPNHAPQLRSLMGRLLRGGAAEPRQPEAPTSAIPDPDYTIPDANGQQVELYSGARMREALNAIKAELKAEHAKELEPFKTDLSTRHERVRQAEAKRAADDWAEQRYVKVSTWPQFKTYEAEIAAAIQADSNLDIAEAYIEIVMPHLGQQARSAVVTQLQDKASAASPNPGSPASSVNTPPRTFLEGFQQMAGG